MKKLLAVVDFQRDAVEGSQGFEGAKQIEDAICRKICQVRAAGGKILFTLDTHYGEHWEKKNLTKEQDLRSGWELYGKVAECRLAEDKIISKYMYASLEFCDYLLAEQFEEVEIVGLITNVCILCTAVAARMALPEAKIILDETCIAAPDESLHRQAFAVMKSLHFCTVPKGTVDLYEKGGTIKLENKNEFNPIRETEGCIQWIREWFECRSGNAKGVVLGISGGKDSTVVAGLLCKALGKERVLGLLMPNGVQRDIEDSRRICSFLKIPYRVVNIRAGFEGILTSMESIEAAATHSASQETIEVPHQFALSEHTKTNLAPRLRMAVLYAMGQEIGYRVAGTGNYSERYVGYATKWGDTACDFAPIAEFTTDEVIEVGRVLGLPADLLEKAPEDGLSGKTDEDNLGFTYAQLNHYIKTGECSDLRVKAKIDQRHQYGLHKVLPIEMYHKGSHQ